MAACLRIFYSFIALRDWFRSFFLVSWALQGLLGWWFGEDLPTAFFLQTVAFVAFNKVATAQYFVWYFSWIPLLVPRLMVAKNKVRQCRI